MDDAIQNLGTPDVCVVGAGPAGLAVAAGLGATGRRVVVLESGGFRPSRRVQELNDGDSEGVAYNGLSRTRHRGIGGTINIWDVRVQKRPGAKYVPLSARDMDDWPISRDDLLPYYIEAQALCGLGPFEYGAEYWATAERTPFQLQGTGLCNGVYQFGTAERLSRVLLNRVRDATSITLIPAWTVVGLTVEPGARRVLGVRAVGPAGRAVEVKSREVILACGAIENARLLLLADPDRHPGSEWLGRGFMEHARDFSLVLLPTSPDVFDAASFYDFHPSAAGNWIGGRLGPTDEALDSFGLPNASVTLVPRRQTSASLRPLHRLTRRIRSITGTADPARYGWSQLRSPGDTFDAFRIILNLEQRPNPSNRVELSSRSDPFGNPLPRLVLHWTEREQAQLEQLRDLLGEGFQTAKLGHLSVKRGRRPDMSAHHHAGTTRMAENPEGGVVDADSRMFGVENLYLAGASVFPTAGFANPTLTIVALALRLARRVDAGLK